MTLTMGSLNSCYWPMFEEKQKTEQGVRRGFTLAEVLLVVGIIAVLISIVIPVLTKHLERSREAYDVYTMRQAASVVIDYVYQGALTKESAEALGLKWWSNGGDGTNASGVYNPSSGTFSPISSKEAGKGYGKGTKKDSGDIHKYMDRQMYASKEDYTNAVILVSVYPAGHVDVYWKDVRTGKYIGGQGKNGNDPKYSIRLNF